MEQEDVAPVKVVKKPNPVNERNKLLLEEMEAEVKRLEDEKAAWDALASTTYPTSDSQPPPHSSTSSLVPSLADIDLLPAVLCSSAVLRSSAIGCGTFFGAAVDVDVEADADEPDAADPCGWGSCPPQTFRK